MGPVSSSNKEPGVSHSDSPPALSNLTSSNEGGAFDYLNPSAFQSEDILNSSAAGSTGSLRPDSLGKNPHPSLYNASFGGVSVSANQSSVALNSLSEYDMLLQLTRPFHEQPCGNIDMSRGAVFDSDSLATSIRGAPPTHVRLSEIQPLSTSESVPPATINPAQLHSYSASSSSDSNSSRASSLSSCTITGHQLPGPHLQGQLRVSDITSPPSTLATQSSVGSVAGSSVHWNGHNNLIMQQETFSGGRSSHTSSIGQARKRSKQLPYSLMMNGTSLSSGTNEPLNSAEGTSVDQGKATANGIGMGSSSPQKKSARITGDDHGNLKSIDISKEPQVGSHVEPKNMTSITSGVKCLNCETTVG